MKKALLYTLSLVALLCLSNPAQAQYEKGDLLINPGISLLGYAYGFGLGGYSGLPALSVNVEYNITDNIGVGGYGGFLRRSYRGVGSWTNLGFGARGVFHASEVINDALGSNIDAEKLDIYAGLSLGYQTFNWNYDDSYISNYNYSTGGVVFGGILGTRYMFTPNIGVFGELGRGAFGALTLGATFKL